MMMMMMYVTVVEC